MINSNAMEMGMAMGCHDQVQDSNGRVIYTNEPHQPVHNTQQVSKNQLNAN